MEKLGRTIRPIRPVTVKILDTRTKERKELDEMKSKMPYVIELIQNQSVLAKVHFDALKENGFTDAQAMEIITKNPSWK